MDYMELMDSYHSNGHANVTAIPLLDTGEGTFVAVSGPGDLAAGQNGWVRTTYTTSTVQRTVSLSHAILLSSFSGKLIDLHNGVWENGAYNGQRVKLIFLPTLNNHGGYQSGDYAGPTSAVKCHLGIVEFTGDGDVDLHAAGYDDGHPEAVGEAIGYLITQILKPTFYLACARIHGVS